MKSVLKHNVSFIPLIFSLYSFVLTDLTAEKVLVFDMNMSVCFEANDQCEVFTGIFNQARLNKPECALNSSFAVKGKRYKKRILLRCIHHLKSDLIYNMDHMRISGNEPSSVILSQTEWFQTLKRYPESA